MGNQSPYKNKNKLKTGQLPQELLKLQQLPMLKTHKINLLSICLKLPKPTADEVTLISLIRILVNLHYT